jgi:hypothetical protein
VPRLELVGSVSPWPKPIVPCWAKLPQARTRRPVGDEDDQRRRAPADEAGDRLPAAVRVRPLRICRRRPEGALAEHREQGREQGEGREQHHRDPDRQDRAEPVGRFEVGDEQHQHRRDHRPGRGGERRRALAHRCGQRLGRRPPALHFLAVAVDEEQRVVGAGAEHEYQQEEGALGVDGDPAGVDRQVGDPDRDQVGRADGEQRQERQERRSVDEQQQDQDQRERRHQERLARFGGHPVEVGGDPGRAGDVGADPRNFVAGEVFADLDDAAFDGARVGGVDRQHDQRRFAVARERPDAVDVLRDVAERLGGVGGEGVDDRRRPGHVELVQADPQPADRVEVAVGEPAFAVEDDHRRDLFGRVAALLTGAARAGADIA